MRGVQADTPEDLSETASRQRGAGARFLLIGGVMLALGVVLLVLDVTFGGWALLALGVVPTLVGIALEATAWVSKRSASGKPFA